MIYNYNCKTHGYFLADKPVEKRAFANCPKCGEKSPKVITYVSAIQFKGKGFTKSSGSLDND